jgi:hypothetical protein
VKIMPAFTICYLHSPACASKFPSQMFLHTAFAGLSVRNINTVFFRYPG